MDYAESGRLSYGKKAEHLLVGIMSGTSLDGIDAILTKISSGSDGSLREIRLEASFSLPYSTELKAILLRLCSPETARIDELVYAHFGLAEWYATAVRDLLAKAGVEAESVDALCLHGQTVWHAPIPRDFPAPGGGSLKAKGTLQIGSGPALAERVGIPVIFDFRSRDMAAGGEGAPLAPFVDALLFGSPDRGRIVQNIGGIGNATVLPAGSRSEGIFAFDTGPGNMIMDELVRRQSGGREEYDEGGRRGAAGRVDEEFAALLASEAWFLLPPPKSTGREVYGSAFVDTFEAQGRLRGLGPDDLVATAAAFTARSIVDSYEKFIFPNARIDDVVVGGGGALNPFLMDQIRRRLPARVSLMSTEELGVPELAREAMAFALLGHEALCGRPGNLPEVTGAARSVILGNLTL